VPGIQNLVLHKAVESTPTDAASFLTFVQVGTLNIEGTKNENVPPEFIHFSVPPEFVHHVCFNTPDLYADSVPLVIEKGCKVPFVYIKDSLIEENHIDTSDVGGIVTSLRPDPLGQRSAREKAAMEHLELNGWQFRGLGIGVNDLDKLVAYYQDLGMGTFQPEAAFDSREIADFKINGTASDTLVKARTRIAQVGSINYEFVQPLEGDTIYKESVDVRGDGVCNFIFTVADLEAETAKLAEKGVQVLMGGNPKNDGAFAYCDTREVGDMVMKLIQG